MTRPPQERKPVRCWKCQRTFELTFNLDGTLRRTVDCVYCHADCVIDLSPYVDEVVPIYKGAERPADAPDDPDAPPALVLPDVIPTRAPRASDAPDAETPTESPTEIDETEE